jgi:hypothetical protein
VLGLLLLLSLLRRVLSGLGIQWRPKVPRREYQQVPTQERVLDLQM